MSDYIKKLVTDPNNKKSHYENLSGIKFGVSVILRKAPIRPKLTHAYWVCECVCGKIFEASAKNIKRNKLFSCGCTKKERKYKDYTGLKIGKLYIIERTKTSLGTSGKLWKCLCDCGKIKYVSTSSIYFKSVKSCGCLAKGYTKGNPFFKRLLKIYSGMLSRCYNHKNISYKNYGAKGVKVCEKWKKSFICFRDWAINNGYKPELSIDRYPNKNGDYCPKNCRWATNKQQANNRNNNHFLKFKGEIKTISEWAEEKNISFSVINQRLRKLGWDVSKTLTTPVKKIKKHGIKRLR